MISKFLKNLKNLKKKIPIKKEFFEVKYEFFFFRNLLKKKIEKKKPKEIKTLETLLKEVLEEYFSKRIEKI